MAGRARSNLTSDDAIKKLFEDVVVPLARRAEGAALAFRAQLDDDSFLREPWRRTLSAADLRRTGELDELEALQELWAVERPELLELLPHLERIRRALDLERQAADEGRATPDPLTYPMW